MKALSLWQPWASAIALGSKRVETRHWSTKYRGPLAIHAAKRLVKADLIYCASSSTWRGALGLHMVDWTALWQTLPFGALVAVCDLVDCRPTESFTDEELDTPRRPSGATSDAYNWTERQMGNFDILRFGWVLENVRILPQPIPFRGGQGLFEVPRTSIPGAG